MTACGKTRDFFLNGSSTQFERVLGLYDQALRMKAEAKSSKPENVIKLDKWYQNDLPKKIKSRGKDPHLTHEELVQTIKWKLARGKFRPNLTNLVQMNTPRIVINDTKKAFRNLNKRGDLQAAAQALCTLKGVGPAMASAVLAAGAPHVAPFMADECLWAMPDVDSLDYTMKEYMRFVEQINATVERLNSQGGSWTPHKVELAIWTYYITNDLKPELLIEVNNLNKNGATETEKSNSEEQPQQEDVNNLKNGTNDSEDSNISTTESSSTAEDSNSAVPASTSETTINQAEAETLSNTTTSPEVTSNGSRDAAAAPEVSEPSSQNGESNGTPNQTLENGNSNGEKDSAEENSNPSNTETEDNTKASTEQETCTSDKKAEGSSSPATETSNLSSQEAPTNESEESLNMKRKSILAASEEGNDNENNQACSDEPAQKKLKPSSEEVMTV